VRRHGRSRLEVGIERAVGIERERDSVICDLELEGVHVAIGTAPLKLRDDSPTSRRKSSLSEGGGFPACHDGVAGEMALHVLA
jgi:hypothetical protein